MMTSGSQRARTLERYITIRTLTIWRPTTLGRSSHDQSASCEMERYRFAPTLQPRRHLCVRRVRKVYCLTTTYFVLHGASYNKCQSPSSLPATDERKYCDRPTCACPAPSGTGSWAPSSRSVRNLSMASTLHWAGAVGCSSRDSEPTAALHETE